MKFTISKPYPNFHSARVKSPGLFLRVRVFQTTKEGIMFYGGPLKTKPRGAAVLQAIRFPKDKFTVTEAKAWLKDHDQKYILFEPATKVKKAKYSCECIECGYKLTSTKHCADLKCSKCGGQMRRVGRPGPGQKKSLGKMLWERLI